VLIYLVIRIVWTFQCHELFSVGLYILLNIMNRCSISGSNTKQVLQLQITDLQDNLVVTGTNAGAGPGALNQVTTGTSNTAFGSGAGGAPYGVTTGSGNVMVGAGAGNSCSNGSNNTFIGSNTAFKPGVGYNNGSIALGAGAVPLIIISSWWRPMLLPSIWLALLHLLALAQVPSWSLTLRVTYYPQQGHKKLSWALTLPLPQCP